jgi:hypothetical protein
VTHFHSSSFKRSLARRRRLRLFASGLLLLGSWAGAANIVTRGDILDDLITIEKKVSLSPTITDVTVRGKTVFDQDTVVARRLIFEPDAVLEFSTQAQSRSHTLYVLAKQIVSVDLKRPGRIQAATTAAPDVPASGDGPAGQNGAGDGADGGPGSAGIAGGSGIAGMDAPRLVLFAMTFDPSALIVSLPGSPGGRGGAGGHGGPGGAGARGESASQSAFDCRRGAGRGGNGGIGGTGGPGGPGGRGGNGGIALIITSQTLTPDTLEPLQFQATGGAGGGGGTGGNGGGGGQQGPQGPEQLPWCRGGHGDGSRGRTGPDGTNGGTGSPGQTGELRLSVIPDRVAQRLGFPKDCTLLGLFCS